MKRWIQLLCLAPVMMAPWGGQAGEVPACVKVPTCDGAPAQSPLKPFGNPQTLRRKARGKAYHRGRDLLLKEGEEAWAIGKFTYGILDQDVHGERVEIYLDRGCKGAFERLGTEWTSNNNTGRTILGVPDTGGRVFFKLPPLSVGRHQVSMVLSGDGSRADQVIEVLGRDTKVFVTDVDGTLTEAEYREVSARLEGVLPKAHPGSAAALTAFAQSGYRPLYLTARPEALVSRTRAFLKEHGFPPGIVHTTLGTGAIHDEAAAFKQKELLALKERGIRAAFAIGNRESDDRAFQEAGLFCHLYKPRTPPSHCQAFSEYKSLETKLARPCK